MKSKLLIALSLLALVGCDSKVILVDEAGNQILRPETVSSRWKSDVETACLDGIEYWVYNPHSQTSTMAVRMATSTEAKTCN